MMQTTELNTQDIIDVRDIIERYEELEDAPHDLLEDEAKEFQFLNDTLEELKGMGGDEQWRGEWYPLQLIRESHFTDYAQQLAEDCGMVNSNAKWPNNCIDWEQAARELRMDYSSVEIDGVTYYFR